MLEFLLDTINEIRSLLQCLWVVRYVRVPVRNNRQDPQFAAVSLSCRHVRVLIRYERRGPQFAAVSLSC